MRDPRDGAGRGRSAAATRTSAQDGRIGAGGRGAEAPRQASQDGRTAPEDGHRSEGDAWAEEGSDVRVVPATKNFLEQLLEDPMVRLFMASDGISDDDMRRVHSRPDPHPDGEPQ